MHGAWDILQKVLCATFVLALSFLGFATGIYLLSRVFGGLQP